MSKNARTTDERETIRKSKKHRHHDHSRKGRAHGRNEWFQNVFNLSEEGLSGKPPDSENVVMEQPVVVPTETAPADMRVTQPIFLFLRKGPGDQIRASQLTGTLFLRILPKIQIVKFVSSRKLLELCAGTARKREETVLFILLKCGDAFTADHIILNAESESRLQHRFAVVVPDHCSCCDDRPRSATMLGMLCKTDLSHDGQRSTTSVLQDAT